MSSAATTLFPTSDSPIHNQKPRLTLVKCSSVPVEEESTRKLLNKIQDAHIRRDRNEATTWDYFVHSTCLRPMYGGNPVLEASSGWDFGQLYWNDDDVVDQHSTETSDSYGQPLK